MSGRYSFDRNPAPPKGRHLIQEGLFVIVTCQPVAVARKIAYNVVLNSFLKVFSTVFLSLLSIRLITGYLGQDGFGKYATVLAFFSFFSALADLGLGSVTAREISREGADEGKILGNVLAMRLLASSAVVIVAPFLISFFGYTAEIKAGIFFAAAATLFSSLSLVLNGVFQKRLAMDKVAMTEFFGKLLQVGFVSFVVRADFGFLAIAASLLASLSFNALVVFLLSRRYVRFRLRFETAYWKQFLRESWPMGMTALITFAYFKTDTILLSVMRSNAEVGIYNVAYKVIENLVFFPAMLAGLILPILSRFIYTRREKFVEVADKTFKVFLIIVVPIVTGTWFLSSDIVRVVSGSGFPESAPVLSVLVFSLACIFFGSYFNMILVVGNAQRQLMQTLILAALFNIALNLFLITRFSYMGAAFASFATEFLVVVLTSWLTRKYVRYRPSFRHSGRIFFSGAAMALALFLLRGYPFYVSGLLSSAVYLSALWWTKAVAASELVSLISNKDSAESALEQSVETIAP